jgi:hypothetical protein
MARHNLPHHHVRCPVCELVVPICGHVVHAREENHESRNDDLDEASVLRIAHRAVQLYAETHRRPTQVNQTQAAEMLGVSTRTVRNYIRFGSLRLNGAGLLPIEAIDAIRASK